MNRRISMGAAALVLAVAPALQADESRPPAERRLGSDTFVFGGSLRVDEPVPGDLFAAGGNVDVDVPVGGDAVLAGGNVRVNAGVGQNLYAAGGRLTVDAPVGRNLRAGGGQIDVGPKGTVAGNVTVGGGQVSLRGAVKGAISVSGGRVLIDAPVDGDVVSYAGQLRLGPNARVAGALRHRGGLERDPAAQVAGAVEAVPPPGRGAAGARDAAPEGSRWGGPGWFWTAGVMLLAAVLVAALPGTSRRVAELLRARVGPSLLWGFIAVVCIPVAALLLAATLIGLPLALLALLLYAALLLVGYAASGVAIGQWALLRTWPDAAGRTGWRIASAMAAVLALALLSSVPFVGALVALLAVLAGCGAIALLFAPGKPARTPA